MVKGAQVKELEIRIDFATRQLRKQSRLAAEKEAELSQKLAASQAMGVKLVQAFKKAKMAKDALDSRLATQTRAMRLEIRSTTKSASAAAAAARERFEDLQAELAEGAVRIEDLRGDLRAQRAHDAKLSAGKAAAEEHSAALAEELALLRGKMTDAEMSAVNQGKAAKAATASADAARFALIEGMSGDRVAEAKLAWQVVAARKLLLEQLDALAPGGEPDLETIEGEELDTLISLFVERVSAHAAAKGAAAVKAAAAEAAARAAAAAAEEDARALAVALAEAEAAATAAAEAAANRPEYPSDAHVDYAAVRRRAQQRAIMASDGGGPLSPALRRNLRQIHVEKQQKKLHRAYEGGAAPGRGRSPAHGALSPEQRDRAQHISSVERERQRVIRRENMRLLEKIEAHMSPPKSPAERERGARSRSRSRSRSPTGGERPRSVSPGYSQRRREAERINRANVKIVKGLMTVEPSANLKRATWKAADRQHQTYLSNLARRSFKSPSPKKGTITTRKPRGRGGSGHRI